MLERDKELGGILNQCIHNGFGLHRFQEELTGPEYAGRFIWTCCSDTGVQVQLDTMVLQLCPAADAPHRCTASARSTAIRCWRPGAVVLAMGCRERTRGAIAIPGERARRACSPRARPSAISIWRAIWWAAAWSSWASGDIGLIMARRMTLEGAKVLACVELMPYSGGLTRNIVQCLHDYDIPLYLSHTVTDIQGPRPGGAGDGEPRWTNTRAPIPGTEMVFDCDTLLLSVGLIPENELTRQAGICDGPPHQRRRGVREHGDQRAGHLCLRQCGACARPCGLCLRRKRARGRRGRGLCAGGPAGGGRRRAGGEKRRRASATPCRSMCARRAQKAEVFFRVNRVLGTSRIVVQDAVRARRSPSFRREHMAPGEMEHIVLPAALLQKAQGALTLHVQEVAQA